MVGFLVANHIVTGSEKR